MDPDTAVVAVVLTVLILGVGCMAGLLARYMRQNRNPTLAEVVYGSEAAPLPPSRPIGAAAPSPVIRSAPAPVENDAPAPIKPAIGSSGEGSWAAAKRWFGEDPNRRNAAWGLVGVILVIGIVIVGQTKSSVPDAVQSSTAQGSSSQFTQPQQPATRRYADSDNSPAEFFQSARPGASYPLTYIENAAHVGERYDRIVITKSPGAIPLTQNDTAYIGGDLFELHDTSAPRSINPGPSILYSGNVTQKYRDCWEFRRNMLGPQGRYSNQTGYDLTWGATYGGTICAEGRDIVLTFQVYYASGGNIALQSCQTPTAAALANFDFGRNDPQGRGPWSPIKVKCVYAPEYHKVKFTP